MEATLAAHRDWVAAGRPGAVSHDLGARATMSRLLSYCACASSSLRGGDFSAGAFRKHFPGGGGELGSHLHSESGEPIVSGQLLQALLRQLARRGGVAP